MADLKAEAAIWSKIKSFPPIDPKTGQPPIDPKTGEPTVYNTASAYFDAFDNHVNGEKPNKEHLDHLEALHARLLANAPTDGSQNHEFAKQVAAIEWLFSRAAFKVIDQQRGAYSVGLSIPLQWDRHYYRQRLKTMRAASAKLGGALKKGEHYLYDEEKKEFVEHKEVGAVGWVKKVWGRFTKLIDDAKDNNKTLEGKWGFFFGRGIRMAVWGLTFRPLAWLGRKFCGPLHAINNQEAAARLGQEEAKKATMTPFKDASGPIPYSELDKRLSQSARYQKFQSLSLDKKNNIRIKRPERTAKAATVIAQKWGQYAALHKDAKGHEKELLKQHPDRYKEPDAKSVDITKGQAAEYVKDMQKYYADWEQGKTGTKIPNINAYLPNTFRIKILKTPKTKPPGPAVS